MKKILSPIIPYNSIFYKSCYYSAVFPIVRFFNQNIIYFFVNDVFIYKFSQNKNAFNINGRYIECKTLENLFEDLNIGVNSKTENLDILNSIINSLNNNRPVVAVIDCFYKSSRIDTYLKVHWPHYLLVYGYDDQNKIMKTLDHSHTEDLDYQENIITFDELLKCYNGYLKYDNDQNNRTYFEFYRKENNNNSLSAVTNEVCLKIWKENIYCNKNEIMKGLEEMYLFNSYLQKILPNINMDGINLSSLLKGITRILSMKKVEGIKIKSIFKDNQLLVKLSERSIELWNSIRINVIKIIYSSSFNNKCEMFKKLIQKMQEIYMVEEKFYKEIFNLV